MLRRLLLRRAQGITLTDGIVHSDDGAWNYNSLPARSSEFLESYFRPELAGEKRDRFERLVLGIKNDSW